MPEQFDLAVKRLIRNMYTCSIPVPAAHPRIFPQTEYLLMYIGLVEVDDLITGIQLPSMRTWAENYGMGIMWCDIPATGNNATIFA